MRCTDTGLTPDTLAILRQLQCVASGGVLCKVLATTAPTRLRDQRGNALPARKDVEKRLWAAFRKVLAPEDHGGTGGIQLLGNRIVRHPCNRLRNDVAPERHALLHHATPHPRSQLPLLAFCHT